MTVNITEIIVALIGVLGTVITAFVIPWIRSKTDANQQKILSTAARTAVYAAQQIFNSAEADEKKEYAIKYITDVLAHYNMAITINEISVAIEAALKEIKTEIGSEWK